MTIQPKPMRKATDAPATLVHKDGTSVEGVIRNLSIGGAKIEVGNDAVIADDLHLSADALNINADAKVVWRKGAYVGVQFQVRQPAAGAPVVRRRPVAVPQSIRIDDLTAITRR